MSRQRLYVCGGHTVLVEGRSQDTQIFSHIYIASSEDEAVGRLVKEMREKFPRHQIGDASARAIPDDLIAYVAALLPET